ncbi:hypothetical protein DM01DRAFT_1202293 [Hesseltinella vesiculosa]|uniref:Uncharacterized protein n=1 Tax=Hesseltinella vesiculosa TaxID=101127 RepID=A0A1X2G2V8_9FUNG|nr:hypothetical protein DM01DRAFT_1202293 [Hesseltinella vesiculosa]
MLPQFGYIVAQAGADSLGQSNKMYSNRSASPPNVKQEHEPFQGRHDPYSRSPKTTAATLPTSHPTPLTAPPASRPASYLPPPPASAAAPNHYIYSSSPPLANAPPTASGKEEHYYYDQRPPADYRPSPWQPPSTFAYPPPAMYPPPPHWQHTHPSSPPTSFYPPIAYASPYVAPPPVSHDVYPLQYTASNPPVHSFLPTSNPPPGSPSIDLSEKESPYYAKQRWYQDFWGDWVTQKKGGTKKKP